MKEIQYPFAYSWAYDLIAVGEAIYGTEYRCVGCDGTMIPKALGSRKVLPHFAHRAEPCTGDVALHQIAQAIVCDALISAIEDKREYPAYCRCPKCELPMEPVNIAKKGWTVAAEKTVVDGTRSDIVLFNTAGRAALIIEVVVSSDFEKKEGTNSRYRDSGIPILKIHPDWETLPDLRQYLHVDKLVNAKPSYQCRVCKEEEEQRRQWERQHNLFLEFARNAVDKIEPQSGISKPTPATHDKFGSPLKWQTRNAVMRNSGLLATLGFTQQPSRPTLFLLRAGDWKIYADLDSTDVMKIWEVDCNAALYAFPDSHPFRGCLLALVAKKLSEHGVGIRRHFEDHDYCYLCERDD